MWCFAINAVYLSMNDASAPRTASRASPCICFCDSQLFIAAVLLHNDPPLDAGQIFLTFAYDLVLLSMLPRTRSVAVSSVVMVYAFLLVFAGRPPI